VDSLAARRKHAIGLLQDGRSTEEVAADIRVTPRSIYRWMRSEGIHSARRRGRRLRLKERNAQRLVSLLVKWREAPASTHDQEVRWLRARGPMTYERIARLIRDEFRVRYHPGHIGRLLRRIGVEIGGAATGRRGASST
jgi:transposase